VINMNIANIKKPSLVSSLLLALLCAGAGGCGISVEAEVPEVEIKQHDLAFEGVPFAGLIGDVSVSQSFSQKHSKLELPEELDTEVKALGISLIAKNGIQDFGFIHNLRVTMSDEVHAPVEIMSYEQDPAAPAGKILTMNSANPVNTLDQWKTDSATFTIEVAGTLPSDPWTIDLAIRFAGKVKYKY